MHWNYGRNKLVKRATVSRLELSDKLFAVADAEECRQSLKHFVEAAWPVVDPSPFIDGWCVSAICEHLTALTTGQIRFLLITIPPRHAKSTICSVLWPVWSWLHRPEDKFLCASYSLNLAIRDNLKKRNLIHSRWFQERYGQSFKLVSASTRFLRQKEFTLSPEQNAKRFFLNDKLGYQLACSVGSTTTGEGGSVLIIDDAHSATEAHSEVEREAAVTWFKEVWSNRMNDAARDRMLTIGQRIHEEDVPGTILRERPDWEHLNLPAEYDSSRQCFTSIGWTDPRTHDGALLWPERFSQETLERYKRDLGPMGYAAQYDQSPVPAEGGVFKVKNERLFTESYDAYFLHTPKGIKAVAKEDCVLFLTVDPAISEKESADYTVIGLWARTEWKDILLLDVIRGHWDHYAQQMEIEDVFVASRAEFIAVETVAYQHALFQDIVVRGFPSMPYQPHKDKVARAGTASIWQANGKIYFLKDAPWLPELRKELYKFPRARHDDITDMISLASIVVRSRGPLADSNEEEKIPAPAEETGGLTPLPKKEEELPAPQVHKRDESSIWENW